MMQAIQYSNSIKYISRISLHPILSPTCGFGSEDRSQEMLFTTFWDRVAAFTLEKLCDYLYHTNHWDSVAKKRLLLFS